MRPGREPAKDWTRLKGLRAKRLSLGAPDPRRSKRLGHGRASRRFSGAQQSQGRANALFEGPLKGLIQMGDWCVVNYDAEETKTRVRIHRLHRARRNKRRYPEKKKRRGLWSGRRPFAMAKAKPARTKPLSAFFRQPRIAIGRVLPL